MNAPVEATLVVARFAGEGAGEGINVRDRRQS
jgi:hypothetical protein